MISETPLRLRRSLRTSPARQSDLDGERATHRASPQRVLAFGLLVLAIAALAWALTGVGPASKRGPHARATALPGRPRRTLVPGPFAVGLRVERFVDWSRTLSLPDGSTRPRTLLTYIRYPALGPARATDVQNAPPARASGPFPLVVFGHGFDVSPAFYERLLQAWAHAGYVVAAPAFPLENPSAPGGPNEADLVNQPGDERFLITRLLAASSASSGPLAGLIDPSRIALSGQSDGGDTALAVAYDPRSPDRRVRAVIVLSGAEMPGAEGLDFAGGPPLLAAQGTADTVNPPSETDSYFRLAHRPKYLLELLGAGHLPPYSSEQPQLAIVTRVSLAFLDGYLEGSSKERSELPSLGDVPGKATLLAEG